MQQESAFITMPKGFQAAGIHCGLKKTNDPDLALVYSDCPAVTAGVYTRNLVKGHSLLRTINIIQSNRTCRGILINSGSANACIGPQGDLDAEAVAAEAAAVLGLKAEEILTCSTGVIGKRMNVSGMIDGIKTFPSVMSSSEESSHLAMQAIMTTDTVPKESSAIIEMDGKTVVISGMAKGSGMIHPDLATMIGVFTTDADIEADVLDKLLRNAIAKTFNRVSVDGDTSVCDSVIIMANKMSGVPIIEGTKEYELFASALYQISEDISRIIAADGEGATKLIEVQVSGAATEEDALLIVRSICRSPLCKTAIFGEDANVGRILTAAGYSGAAFDPGQVDISIGELLVCKDGLVLPFDEIAAKELLSQKEILISVRLSAGDFADRMWTCDFSYDYVKINGSYRS